MASKVSHFDLEWWVIQKRAIYLAALTVVLCIVAGGAGLYIWKYGNPFKNVATLAESLAGARFMSFEGDVRVIRSSTRQVVVANNDIQLYPGDTVQTQADGRARISMADGSTVVVRPNSTIIIRDNAKAEDGKRSNVHVVVDSGQMLVRTEEQSGVNSGAVESVNRRGEHTSLKGGEYVSVNQSGTVSKPQRLLEVPQPFQPRDLENIPAASNGSATVPLRWQRPQSGTPSYYRVEVATSPFFVPEGKVIERDQLVVTQFVASDLRPGAYFWRIRATAASGQISDWSEPLKFLVSTKGVNLANVPVSNLSAVHLGGNVYLIRGTSLPATKVVVAGREAVAALDGSFQIQIAAPAGAREVILQASDSQGNRSQYRLTLYGSS
jgi:hypothetical protein